MEMETVMLSLLWARRIFYTSTVHVPGRTVR